MNRTVPSKSPSESKPSMLEIQFGRRSCLLHLYAIRRISRTTKPADKHCTMQFLGEHSGTQRCCCNHSYLQRAETLHVLKNLVYLSGAHHNGLLSSLNKNRRSSVRMVMETKLIQLSK